MYRYIKSTISIENLKAQFAQDIDDELFNQLIDLDPTTQAASGHGGKYCPWILKQYNAGNLTEDDFVNLKDALSLFVKQYKKYPESDIGKYKTVEDFLVATEEVGNRELTDKEKKKLLKKAAHKASDKDKEFIVSDGEWEVWKPLTHAGSIALARTGGVKARWCTAYEGNPYHWNSYTQSGPLYIFINTNNPNEKYQLHFQSDSWYDINDKSLGMNRFFQFCAKHPVIAEALKVKTYGGIVYVDDEFHGYVDGVEEIRYPDGITELPGLMRWVNDVSARVPVADLPSSVRSVIIPSSIKFIPAYFFYGNTYGDPSRLTSVKLGGVTRIGKDAFARTAIHDIDLSNVTTIGAYAFSYCKELSEVKFSSAGVKIGTQAFAEDSNLRGTVTITDGDTISWGVFDGCENLTIEWDTEDGEYEFDNIGRLIVDKNTCPTIYDLNREYIATKELKEDTV